MLWSWSWRSLVDPTTGSSTVGTVGGLAARAQRARFPNAISPPTSQRGPVLRCTVLSWPVIARLCALLFTALYRPLLTLPGASLPIFTSVTRLVLSCPALFGFGNDAAASLNFRGYYWSLSWFVSPTDSAFSCLGCAAFLHANK